MADIHLIQSKINRKRLQITEVSVYIRKSGSRTQMLVSEFSPEAYNSCLCMHIENMAKVR